nr:MAG TPA: tail assembly chaperone protein [Caudoviricetes sp.]
MRKEKDIIIEDDGHQLKFRIRQMPATVGFIFGMKFMKLVSATVDKVAGYKNDMQMLLQALAAMDVQAFSELQAEALECVSHVATDGKPVPSPRVCTPQTLDEIVTDPLTVLELTKQSMELNLSFIERALPASLRERLYGALRADGQECPASSQEEK